MKSAAEEQKAGAHGTAADAPPTTGAHGLILHRIIAGQRNAHKPALPDPGSGRPAQDFTLERAASTALGRAAEKQLRLPVFVESVELLPMTLPELSELLPERALLAVLEGAQDALGVMALCPSFLASIIEMQAIGRVTSRPPATRRPTRTDAAMSTDFVNGLLTELGRETGGRPGIPAFGTFRYATHMDDPRPLGLMLEDAEMQRLQLKFRVGAGGQRDASILIALPAAPGAGRGRVNSTPAAQASGTRNAMISAPPSNNPAAPVTQAPSASLPESLAEAVQLAPIQVVGILCRRKLSLQALRALGPGSMIPLPQNVLDDARLETTQGQLLARGRLGEADGFHAIRLRQAEAPARGSTAPVVEPAFGPAHSSSHAPAHAPSHASLPATARASGIDGLPPLAGVEPPLADIDSPDAFRDAQTAARDKAGLRS